jgi:hypothetical protein
MFEIHTRVKPIGHESPVGVVKDSAGQTVLVDYGTAEGHKYEQWVAAVDLEIAPPVAGE